MNAVLVKVRKGTTEKERKEGRGKKERKGKHIKGKK